MLVRRQQKRKTQTEANLLGQESQLYEEQATAQMNEACSENLKARQPEYHQQLTTTTVKECQLATASDTKSVDTAAAPAAAVVPVTEDVAPSAGGDEMLVNALQKKYDALRDKLLLEVLMKKVGEAEWTALPKRERQDRLLKLKTEEKRLRMEGKMDEAAALLGSVDGQEEAMVRSLGDTRAEDNIRLEERQRRRQELINEWKEKGLSTEEVLLNAIQYDKEAEKRKKRRTILEELDDHFEVEKATLLAALHNHDNEAGVEQHRQVEIAKLKRQKNQLQRVDKFASAALLVQESKEQDEVWENNSKKEQQIALARDRVAVHRQKRAKVDCREQLDGQLAEEDTDAAMHDDGATVHDELLDVMEKKQMHERDTLLDLIVVASSDAECQQQDDDVSVEGATAELQNLHSELEIWKSDVHQQMTQPEGHEMSRDQKDEYFAQITTQQTELSNHLKRAVTLRFKAEKAAISKDNPELSAKELLDETTVQLLARLQQRHAAEDLALYAKMFDLEKEALESLLEAEKVAATEAWLDNVVATVYSELGSAAKLKEELEKELENEKQGVLESNRNLPPGEQIDIDSRKVRLEARRKTYVKEMQKKHIEEREQLMSVLQDPSFEELCQIATAMSDEDKKKRLLELLDKQQKLNLQDSEDDREEGFSILEEVAAICCTLEMTPGDTTRVSDELVDVLLAELQVEQIQEKDVAQLTELREKDLKRLCDNQHWDTCTNALNALVHYKDSVKDKDCIQALEEKYDVLRDKLLMEALIAQLGETEWKLMSEQERQRRLMQLKLEERRLRHEGKLYEINRLLEEGAVNQERLQQLLGDSKEDAERRLKERLALRKKRLAEGLSETECDNLEEREVQEDRKRRNVLLNLQMCFDEEKAALLRSLDEQKDRLAAELVRQLMLVKLKHDKRRMKEEEKFENVARLLKDFKEQAEVYEAARKRQEELARAHFQSRLKARQKLSANQILGEDGATVPLPETDDDVTLLQDAVMKEVDLRHQQEIELLMALFPDPDVAAHRKQTRQLGNEAMEDRREELRLARKQWKDSGAEDPHQQLPILKEAMGVEMEILHQQLANDGKDSSDEFLQDALLADLQQRQDSEAQRILNNLAEKETKSQHASARERKFYDNIAAVVLATDDVAPSADGDDMLADALQKKHDALRDKLFLEMHEKLAERREARRHCAKERQSNDAPRCNSCDSQSSGDMLKREKTVVDVSLSDNTKEETAKQLIAQQATLKEKIIDEKKKHEKKLEERLTEKKMKRSLEAKAVMETAEKQRANLEKTVQDERERCVMKTNERVECLRYEKTMTMMQKGDKSAKTFDEMTSDKNPGVSDDETMQLAATQMQDRFKQEELEKTVELPVPEGPQLDMNINPEQEDNAMKKLKEKRKQKKKEKQLQENCE